MLPQPHSVIAFGIMRHQDIQAENIRVRLAMTAVASRQAPGLPRRARAWVGSALIRIGTCLLAEQRDSARPRAAFRAGVS
jgi:hypothetical protein